MLPEKDKSFYRAYLYGFFTDSFVAIVEKLIKNGADIEARSTIEGTPLHKAALNGSFVI